MGKQWLRRPSEIEWSSGTGGKGGVSPFHAERNHGTAQGAWKIPLPADWIPGPGKWHWKAVSGNRPFLKRFKKITILAMGTSYYAGLVGKFLLEKYLRVPVEVDNASEFRYRNPVLGPDSLVLVITQSGETVDTLVALREAKPRGPRLLPFVTSWEVPRPGRRMGYF